MDCGNCVGERGRDVISGFRRRDVANEEDDGIVIVGLSVGMLIQCVMRRKHFARLIPSL